MTDDHPVVHLCPVCGKENLPMNTRCVHCGAEMESLFTFDGLPSTPLEDDEHSLPDIIEDIRNDPALRTPAEPDEEAASPTEEGLTAQGAGIDSSPEWLSKVRQRARGEEDAVGGLVSGINAMDALRSEEGSAGLEGEFTAWISRIREQNQQENSSRFRQQQNEVEEPGEVPEWLQRIRALRLPTYDGNTQESESKKTYPNGVPQEWTDEALMELRRQALAEEGAEESEELPQDVASGEEEEPATALGSDDFSDAPEPESEHSEEPFHNIPEDEKSAEVNHPDATVDEYLTASAEQAQAGAHELPETEEMSMPEALPEEQAAESQGETQSVTPEPSEKTADAEVDSAETLAADDSEAQESTKPDDAPELEQPRDSSSVLPDLLLLRDQQNRANLLASLIEQEGREIAGRQPSKQLSGKGGRIAVALLLIIGLVVSMLIGHDAPTVSLPMSVPAGALNARVSSLTKADQVLVVLDYQAAASRELETLAAPVLKTMRAQGAELIFLTAQPSGLFLGQSLLEKAGLSADTKIEYLPGSYLSLIGWAMNPAAPADLNPTLANSQLAKHSLSSFGLILLISDSSENVRGWLEQIAPWQASSTFAAVTTQMEAPVLAPYFDSGQLVGYAFALADGSPGAAAAFSFRAYRVGLLLMLAMLVLSAIAKADADAVRREEERAK